jgi:hypothetical protein
MRLHHVSLILAVAFPWVCSAQTLPKCQGNDHKKWNNCFGIQSFRAGRYEGEFRNGKLNGFGTLNYTQGDRYVGHWREDQRDGFGSYTHPSGNKYTGQWKDGKPHGQGISILSNRGRYVGHHLNGQRQGEGVLYAADGSVEASGLWKDGQLISPYLLDTNHFPNNQIR